MFQAGEDHRDDERGRFEYRPWRRRARARRRHRTVDSHELVTEVNKVLAASNLGEG